jgi:uncharacterized protein (UPF0332 family)
LNEDQALALFEAKENLRGARINYEQGLPKIAASRAYYAMFYAAQALLFGEGQEFSKHSAVIAAFGNRFAKTGRVPATLHRYLIEAQEFRNKADYKLGAIIAANVVELQIEHAREFVTTVEQLLGSVSNHDRELSDNT